MSKYEVEKGVPVPRAQKGTGPKYPWPDMGHMDSFKVDCEPDGKPGITRTLTTSAHGWLKRNRPGWKAVTRHVDGGVRIWFIDPSQNGDG